MTAPPKSSFKEPTPALLATGVVVAIASIIAGAALLARNLRGAYSEVVIRYTFGDRGLGDVDAQIHHATAANFGVILGYLLLFGTCAAIFAVLAFSRLGRIIRTILAAAVVVVAVADTTENGLVLWSLRPPRWWLLARLPARVWVHAPAAMATLTWCALVVAVLTVPAAVLCVIRLALSYLWRWRYRRRHRDAEWWDTALDGVAGAPESRQDDPEAAWKMAYFVPGRQRRDAQDGAVNGEKNPTTALCLSGGGIRSACVAMGAMQTLASPAVRVENRWTKAPFLDDFDYIISVSGGGYSTGARLLAVQSTDGKQGNPQGAIHRLADRFTDGSVEFDFLRRRSSYIADSPTALIRALAEVLKNLLASLFLVFSIAAIVGWLLGWFLALIPLAAFVPCGAVATPAGRPPQPLAAHPVAALAAIAMPLALATLFGCAALLCEWKSTSRRATRYQGAFNRIARGCALLAVLVTTITVAVPGLVRLGSWIAPVGHHGERASGAATGVAGVVVLHYVTALASMVWKKKDTIAAEATGLRQLLPPGVVRIGLVLVTLAVLLAAWLVTLGVVGAQIFTHAAKTPAQLSHLPNWLWILVVLIVFTTVLSSFDVTSLSLHPFYRQRLGRTFAVRRIGGTAKGYDPQEPTWLDLYGHAQSGRPEFVFACAAAISDDDVRPAPGLNAVSYVLGADYVGGPALGWLSTPGLRQASAARIQRDLTVQAAMAVSGAAFASAMGRQSKGFQTLLALSGARLGTWLPNPAFVKAAKAKRNNAAYPKSLPSVRGAGYFYRELFAINKPDARLVQVTDGGHYENLGIIEALRRKCRLIYCIDASGDTQPLLSGLDDAIRLAKFELGVEITLDHRGDYAVTHLAPGSAEPFGDGHAFCCLNSRITKDAVVRAKITYPDAAGLGAQNTGWLVVAKAVLWRELPDWVLTYGAGKDGQEFPHDKTSDQWFNETQFAVYTEVGRRIAERALQVRPYPAPAATQPSATVAGPSVG